MGGSRNSGAVGGAWGGSKAGEKAAETLYDGAASPNNYGGYIKKQGNRPVWGAGGAW